MPSTVYVRGSSRSSWALSFANLAIERVLHPDLVLVALRLTELLGPHRHVTGLEELVALRRLVEPGRLVCRAFAGLASAGQFDFRVAVLALVAGGPLERVPLLGQVLHRLVGVLGVWPTVAARVGQLGDVAQFQGHQSAARHRKAGNRRRVVGGPDLPPLAHQGKRLGGHHDLDLARLWARGLGAVRIEQQEAAGLGVDHPTPRAVDRITVRIDDPPVVGLPLRLAGIPRERASVVVLGHPGVARRVGGTPPHAALGVLVLVRRIPVDAVQTVTADPCGRRGWLDPIHDLLPNGLAARCRVDDGLGGVLFANDADLGRGDQRRQLFSVEIFRCVHQGVQPVEGSHVLNGQLPVDPCAGGVVLVRRYLVHLELVVVAHRRSPLPLLRGGACLRNVENSSTVRAVRHPVRRISARWGNGRIELSTGRALPARAPPLKGQARRAASRASAGRAQILAPHVENAVTAPSPGRPTARAMERRR